MKQHFGYLPKKQRIPDTQYQELIKKILTQGEIHRPIHNEASLRIVGHVMHFKRQNGFTATPTRDLEKYDLIKGAIGENVAFMNGAHTLKQLEKYGCPPSFWSKWVTKEKCQMFGLSTGDLGPGSYGAAWAKFPKPDGTSYNQIKGLVQQMVEKPMLRTITLDPWIPFYTVAGDKQNPRSVVVAPCHGWVHIHINTDNHTFKLEHKQRSADCPVGLQFNMVQYFAMGLMLEKVTGYHFTDMIYYISDAHIYESQYEYARTLIARSPRIYPVTYLTDDAPENIFKFRPHHFQVDEYTPHPWFKIPTPI